MAVCHAEAWPARVRRPARETREDREKEVPTMAVSRRTMMARIGGVSGLAAFLAACGGEAAPAAAPCPIRKPSFSTPTPASMC